MAEARAGEETPLRLDHVQRHYAQGDERLDILTGADLTLAAGEMVALVAPSGAGKSTLLHIAGLLERPDGGDVIVNGLVSAELDDAARTRLRRETIGFVYQSHYLLGEFSAVENVMVPQMLRGLPRGEARQRSTELLRLLGLAERVFAMLGAIVRATGLAALVATHNLDLAARMDRRVTLRSGKIVPVE